MAITTRSNAQIGVGVSTANIHPSALLDVSSTTKGFLPPRMTYAQRNAIVNPGAGLIVYCTNCGTNGEMQYYNATHWMSMSVGTGSIPISLPTISTTSISNLLAGAATCGGNISTDGNGTISARGVCWSTSSNPTIDLSTKTVDGTGIGSFTSSITGLTDNTTYHVRSYATNQAGTAYGGEVGFTVGAATIGTQLWTTQNLNVSTYRNGDIIPKVENGQTWGSITYGAYCYYNNDSATYASIYGKLYNWYAVNDPRGLAPVGYHIPSDDEWTTLTEYLGGYDVAGGKIKEAGTSHWVTPNTGADNSSGFAGLPGGVRNQFGSCNWIGLDGFWWTSTLNYSTMVWYRKNDYSVSDVWKINGSLLQGMSVRCIKD